jgi:hypothetical protein
MTESLQNATDRLIDESERIYYINKENGKDLPYLKRAIDMAREALMREIK